MTPETEAKLNELAERTHRSRDELLEEAVNRLVAHNGWFEHKVQSSIPEAERGAVVPDKEVRKWIEQKKDFKPIEISGEPLSETSRRERR